jgi:hypothetical protein
MASDHGHDHHDHHGHHEHSESCEHGHAKERPSHIFNRGDLLRNYQTLENIASVMPPQLLMQPMVVQMDALVGAFEHHLLHQHSDHHCSHDHSNDDGDDKEEAHEHHHEHADVDPWEEVLKDDLALVSYRSRIQSAYKPLHTSIYDFNRYKYKLPCNNLTFLLSLHNS